MHNLLEIVLNNLTTNWTSTTQSSPSEHPTSHRHTWPLLTLIAQLTQLHAHSCILKFTSFLVCLCTGK